MRTLDFIMTRYILLLTYLDKITFDGFREMERHFFLETLILIIVFPNHLTITIDYIYTYPYRGN